MDAYSVVLTSCGRFELLRRTLASLLPALDAPFAQFIIVEDSGDARVREAVAGFGVDFDILVNETKQGQIGSIDRAYSHVKAPLIFHCEDDWEFFRAGWLEPSARLLQLYPDVSMVGLRPRADLNPLMRDVPSREAEGIAFYVYDPRRHPEYFSYSFNPGLRRAADYRRLGPFAPIGHEPDISYAFKRAGFRMAALEQPAVRHIGWDHHVEDPFQPSRDRGFSNRLRKSVQKRVKRVARLFSS
jgi:hypothetical protein